MATISISILDSISEPVISISRSGEIRYKNTAAAVFLKNFDTREGQIVVEEMLYDQHKAPRPVFELFSEVNESELLLNDNGLPYPVSVKVLERKDETIFLSLRAKHAAIASTALESAMDGVALLDASGKYYYLNDAHVRLFGYDDQSELIGKSWHTVYSEEEINRIEGPIFQQLQNSGTYTGETTGCSKTGEPVYQEITLTTLDDGGLICICRDISSRHRIRKEKEKLALVAKHTDSIVFITDHSGRIEWINESFRTYYGYEEDEVRGRDPLDILVGTQTSRQTIQEIRESINKAQTYSGEVLNYHRSGRTFWTKANITPVLDADGRCRQFVIVKNDITEISEARRKAKNALEKEKELNQMKSDFITLASHEFRTPVTGIKTNADLLRMLEMRLDPTTKKMFSKYIRRIEHESDRIIEILEGIMLAGRNFSGIERFNPRPVNAHKLIRSSVREYAQAAVHEQKPLLQVNGPERMVVMDPQFIEYVIHNLLRNAYMYDPDKQPPLVVMEYGPAELQVQVKDRGIGIPDKEIDKVFESFYRASNIHTVPGMGLGLVLAKQFIELHNGKISVKSTEGEGTTVSFRIPYVQDPVRPGFSPNKTHSSAQAIKA